MLSYCSAFSACLIPPINSRSISTHPAFISNALTFKLCLLQTTRKEFAEHWVKDTYCATNKEGWNTIKILSGALKCHEILNYSSASHPTIAHKYCQRCHAIAGCLQQLNHTGTLDHYSLLLRLLMAFLRADHH